MPAPLVFKVIVWLDGAAHKVAVDITAHVVIRAGSVSDSVRPSKRYPPYLFH